MQEINDQLKNKLDTTFNIFLELEFMKNGIVDVSNEQSKYFQKSCQKSQFFHTSFKAFSKLFFIEIYKLLDKNGDYNLLKTVSFCKRHLDNINWHTKIDFQTLEKLEQKLNYPEETLSIIKTLRDKFYAHSDKNRFNYNLKIDKLELWKILDNLQDVFRILCSNFNNTCWIFNIQYQGTPELRSLSNYSDLHQFVMQSKIDGKDRISVEELEKIIRN